MSSPKQRACDGICWDNTPGRRKRGPAALMAKTQSKQELVGLSRQRGTLAVAKDRAAALSMMLGRPVSVAEAIDAAMMVATPEQMADYVRSIPPARVARRGRPKKTG